MVKLAKKHNRAFEHYTADLRGKVECPKTGIINLDEITQKIEKDFDTTGSVVLIFLWLLSCPKNIISTNIQLQTLAIKPLCSMADENDGFVNVDQYRQTYNLYKNMLGSIWTAKKIERKKSKKFGDPPYPKLEELFSALEELEKAGLLDQNRKPKSLTLYEIALFKQSMKNEGISIDEALENTD